MQPMSLARRLGVGGAVLALVAGCSPSPGSSSLPTSGTTATPAPTATASPSPAPTAAPTPFPATPTPTAAPSPSPGETRTSGWPYRGSWDINDVQFHEDGRVVLVESRWEAGEGRITVLDADGSPVPGWPWTPGQTGDAALHAALGPDDSIYVTARGATDRYPIAWSWRLHRLAPDGTEMAGFPVGLPDVPFCDLAVHGGAAFVSCGDEDEESGVVTAEVTVVEPDGSTRSGWPTEIDMGAGIVGFGPDGRVYLQQWFGGPEGLIMALAPDGRPVEGWPRRVPGASDDDVQIDAQGRVRATSYRGIDGQCAAPARTVYTMLRTDGSTAAGWPVRVRGWSSMPELADDGPMVVASATGRVIAYSSRGVIRKGWPVRGVGVTVGCWGGSRPWAAGNGTTVIVGDGRATLLTASGRMASGWPVTLPYEVANSCNLCAPGPGGPVDPAVGKRAVYIGAYRSVRQEGLAHGQPRVMVIERDGSMPAEAQRRIGTKADDIAWIRIAPTGRVWALLTRYDDDAEQQVAALYLVAQDAVPGS